jgi:hypothetical protein
LNAAQSLAIALTRECRVEWFGDDSGANRLSSPAQAREQALLYAERQYGDFEVFSFHH